jgi:hypothetical protein
MATTKTPRGGDRAGSGRKPLDPSGEAMKARRIRMTDAQWADAKLLGDDAVRTLITKAARKLRQEPK